MPHREETEEQAVGLQVRVPKSVRLAVKLRCIEESTTMAQFILEAIQAKLGKGK